MRDYNKEPPDFINLFFHNNNILQFLNIEVRNINSVVLAGQLLNIYYQVKY